MRIVIDTNIWISFLLGKSLSKLTDILLNSKIEIFSSEKQIIEIIAVFSKPKLMKYLNESDLQRILYLLNTRTKKVELQEEIDICRDPKDNFIIETAINSSSEFIITGDKDLLILNPINKLRIITYSEFENILLQI